MWWQLSLPEIVRIMWQAPNIPSACRRVITAVTYDLECDSWSLVIDAAFVPINFTRRCMIFTTLSWLG